jgi:hypothetical protein
LGTRLLIGSDGVDRWSDPRTWTEILENKQIVVSTHKVLADALTHGFVNMLDLALLIFDEGMLPYFSEGGVFWAFFFEFLLIHGLWYNKAHHCARGHPANTIMKNFYHPLKEKNGIETLPHVLGLSASPIARSKVTELECVY